MDCKRRRCWKNSSRNTESRHGKHIVKCMLGSQRWNVWIRPETNSIDTTLGIIEELKAKPARRWDQVVDKVLIGVIGAIVVYIMAQIGF